MTYNQKHMQYFKAYLQLSHRPRCSLQYESSILKKHENLYHEGACFLFFGGLITVNLQEMKKQETGRPTVSDQDIYKVYPTIILSL